MKTVFAIIGAIIGWTAIILQLYLHINNRKYSIPETLINFFSFFTILTNILCACCFTMLIFKYSKGRKSFFSEPGVISASAVYITIVGIVYNLILRSTWNPHGLQMIIDEILHSVIPVYFVLFWVLFIPKENLSMRIALNWLIYPLIYSIWTLIHGAAASWYPYPFIDADKIGYGRTALNFAGLFIFFYLLSLLYVWLSKAFGKKAENKLSAL